VGRKNLSLLRSLTPRIAHSSAVNSFDSKIEPSSLNALHYTDVMHCLVALLLVFQSATVIDVQGNHEVILALQMGDVIYTAEFSHHALKPESLVEGDHVSAEVRDGKMRVKRKDGKIVAARLIWKQRVLVHPIP